MKLLESSTSHSTSSNNSILGFVKGSPIIQFVLLVGSLSFAGYMSIRFWHELKALL